MSKVRIQKYLSEAGVASRRSVEEMILDGLITVNNRLVTELPCFVDPQEDDIRVGSRRIPKRSAEKIYMLLNKPRGVVCTQSDPQGRMRATDMVPQVKDRIYCVGGLDAETTGLVVLTNDGELTQKLTHGNVESTYLVEIDGRLSDEDLLKITKGMYFEDKKTPPAKIRVVSGSEKWSILEIKIGESRNPKLRQIFLRLGHKLRRLKRIAIGPLNERGVKIGHARPLKPEEVRKLIRLSDTEQP